MHLAAMLRRQGDVGGEMGKGSWLARAHGDELHTPANVRGLEPRRQGSARASWYLAPSLRPPERQIRGAHELKEEEEKHAHFFSREATRAAPPDVSRSSTPLASPRLFSIVQAILPPLWQSEQPLPCLRTPRATTRRRLVVGHSPDEDAPVVVGGS